MKTPNIHAAKTKLSQLAEEAAAGEEIIIARTGKPVARRVSLPRPDVSKTFGILKGKIRTSSDFDTPYHRRFSRALAFRSREIKGRPG
jgi:antitoxin (DNA-binding transcriptional repressor) of toxin-antitoxin stability system